jgi:hypothetical protein
MLEPADLTFDSVALYLLAFSCCHSSAYDLSLPVWGRPRLHVQLLCASTEASLEQKVAQASSSLSQVKFPGNKETYWEILSGSTPVEEMNSVGLGREKLGCESVNKVLVVPWRALELGWPCRIELNQGMVTRPL